MESPLKRGNGSINIPWTAGLDYVDRDGIDRLGKGRTFVVEGQDIDLFPIGVLCAVLRRHRKAIYKWEKNHGFPPALYRVSDLEQNGMRVRCNRWYSRKQILYVEACFQRVGCLQGKNRNKLSVFVAMVRQSFYGMDAPATTRINNGQTQEEGRI